MARRLLSMLFDYLISHSDSCAVTEGVRMANGDDTGESIRLEHTGHQWRLGLWQRSNEIQRCTFVASSSSFSSVAIAILRERLRNMTRLNLSQTFLTCRSRVETLSDLCVVLRTLVVLTSGQVVWCGVLFHY